MSVTIDGILGSARKMTQKRTTVRNENTGLKNSGSKDSVTIDNRLNGRLASIQNELKDSQGELTSKQVMREGLKELLDDLQAGRGRGSQILRETTYNGKPVLADFLGNTELTESYLQEKTRENERLLNNDVSRLQKMQVESENIFASNLIANPTFDSNDFVTQKKNADSISNLNADVVMRLTR